MPRAIDPSGNYCMYLRRSRADLDAERMGAGETLARHHGMLQELSGHLLGRQIPDTAIYKEIVSGDTITERPEMRRLLSDVESGMWDGVFVADIDRLARGDTMDQGLVSQTFLYSHTLIITPIKVYDPEDMSDSEFFEIKLFFARREYQMIKRRMQTGRVNAVKEGLYVSSRPIYGYERYKLPDRKGWSLKIVEDQAAVVRSVFDWYVNGMDGESVGSMRIARRLNEMGLKTLYGYDWTDDRIIKILRNPTYTGCVQWYKRRQQTQMQDGKKVKTRVRTDEPIVVPGVHEAIISDELFKQAQDRISLRGTIPTPGSRKCANPLAGLVKCGICGHAMQLWKRKERPERSLLKCSNRLNCTCCAIYICLVEQSVLETLGEWASYDPTKLPEIETSKESTDNSALIAAQQKQLITLNRQLSALRDLLEQGVYTVDVYLERERDIRTRIAACEKAISGLKPKAPTREEAIAQIAPQVKTVLELYALAETPAQKNALLKSVIDRIIYHKSEQTPRGHSPLETLTLEIFPKLPK